MIGRLDEFVQRLVSFFVLPVLNVTIVSLLLHWCLSDNYSVAGLVAKLDLGGLTQYLANLVVAFFSGNVDTLKDMAARYGREIALISSQIAAFSNFVAIVIFLMIVIAMFLLDRFIYAVSWCAPLDFDFDLASYGAQHCGDTRVRRLYALLGQPYDFPTAAGVVRSYLGEHSNDAYRLTRRNNLVRSRTAARVGFDYAKSYLFLLIVAWLAALVTPDLRLGNITALLALSAVIALAYLIWYANAYQSLLEFDIDSFVWLRSFDDKTDAFKVSSPEHDFCSALAQPGRSRLLDMLHLRYQPAGVIHAVYALGRSVVTRPKGNAPKA